MTDNISRMERTTRRIQTKESELAALCEARDELLVTMWDEAFPPTQRKDNR